MADNQPDPEEQTPAQAAAYIAAIAESLSAMARRQGLDTLAYILDMAKVEATNIVHQPPANA